MYLKYVQIVNFKNLKNARFEFAKGANTIIGENDFGKSNALTAIRILLDDNYYYNTKRLKETDFSYALGDWKGHWIIISAFFDEISNEDKHNEFCAELTPEQENIDFLKSASIITVLLPVTVGILCAVNWDAAFTMFHEIMFRNDYWIFDEATDPVIMILPDAFFFHCAVMIILLILIGSLLCMGFRSFFRHRFML